MYGRGLCKVNDRLIYSHSDISICLTLYPLPLDLSVWMTLGGLSLSLPIATFSENPDLYNYLYL